MTHQAFYQYFSYPTSTKDEHVAEVNSRMAKGWRVKSITSTPVNEYVLTQIVFEKVDNITPEKQQVIDAAESLSKIRTFASANTGNGSMVDLLTRNMPQGD